MAAATMESAATPASGGLDLEELFLFVCALRAGNFEAPLNEEGLTGRAAEIVGGLRRFAQQMRAMTSQIERVSNEVTHGVLGGSVDALIPPGSWKRCVDAFNEMQWAITGQLRDFNNTAKLLAQGDTSRKVTVPCEGETLELKTAINAAIDRMRDVKTP